MNRLKHWKKEQNSFYWLGTKIYSVVFPSLTRRLKHNWLTLWRPQATGFQTGIVGGRALVVVSPGMRAAIANAFCRQVSFCNNIKTMVEIVFVLEISFWNMNYFKIKISAFENLTIVKGLNLVNVWKLEKKFATYERLFPYVFWN